MLRPDSTISDDTVSVLRRVHASGATVCVASGRPAATIRRYASQLGLGPIPAVCFNGACAMLLDGENPANDVVWHVEHLSRDVVAQVLDVAAALDLPVQYCLPDKSVTAPANAKQSGLMDQFDALVGPEGHSERVRTLRPEPESEGHWPFPPPLKLIIVTGSQSAADEVAAKARETLPPTTRHVIAAEVHTEFLMPGVDKASPLRARALGIELAQAVRGDANNDVEMLERGPSLATPSLALSPRHTVGGASREFLHVVVGVPERHRLRQFGAAKARETLPPTTSSRRMSRRRVCAAGAALGIELAQAVAFGDANNDVGDA